MPTNWYFRWAEFLGPVALLVMTTTVSHAQQDFSQPVQQGSDQPMISVPPPVVPIPQTTSPAGSPAYPGETIFQAPNNYQRGNPGRYLVYVNGASPFLLQQVQTVEPKAFVQQYQGRQVIQVGTFGDEANARRQVDTLKGQGVMAEVATMPVANYPLPASVAGSPNYPPTGMAGTPNYPPAGMASGAMNSYPPSSMAGMPNPYPANGAADPNAYPPGGVANVPSSYPPLGSTTNSFNSPPPPPTGDPSTYSAAPGGSGISRSSPYLVIIPGGRDELPVLAQRAMGLGIRQDAIQQKDSPLGPHLEIGPFSAYKEANDVSNFLSSSGLDSRVYFSR
ncbi:hypothetical protein K9N68_13635 [Kovacikia minuta CCNUW1]|uniref:SPOR domain-containing protein n=1 Tax=Kovacikia minuta TaxID=2931930 RepID=UPI001CCA66DB|nr:hypothetical protein [Kovacikia minuta]UBF28789.1 hypothetical protein K9N68_13635 [Kovacikia minuta CCNUW1]